MPTTKTKTPSAELDKLQRARDKAYADLQAVKRDRALWEDETEALRGSYTLLVRSRPEDHRDAAGNPKPGTPSAAEQHKLKKRIAGGNPHEDHFQSAKADFHAAAEKLNEFLTSRLPDLLGELEPAFDAIETKRVEAFELLSEVASEYGALEAKAREWIIRSPRLNGQALRSDPRPAQWAKLADENLESPLTAPGLTDVGAWTISNG
jgi:hypothetical protein